MYVDDTCISSKDPKPIITELKGKHNFKLKGVGPLDYHLGTGYYRDPSGVLCGSAQRYIERMLDGFKTMFPGEEPNRQKKTPLPNNDHPEIDETQFLKEEGIQKYQSMMGALKWVVTLGRFDIMSATVRIEPREGHLQRRKDSYGYLERTKSGSI